MPAPWQLKEYKVFEEIAVLLERWIEIPTRANADRSLPLPIHLTQQNFERFERNVTSISTLDHPTKCVATIWDVKTSKICHDRPAKLSKTFWVVRFIRVAGETIVGQGWVKVDVTIGKLKSYRAEHLFCRYGNTKEAILRNKETVPLSSSIQRHSPNSAHMFRLIAAKSHFEKLKDFQLRIPRESRTSFKY